MDYENDTKESPVIQGGVAHELKKLKIEDGDVIVLKFKIDKYNDHKSIYKICKDLSENLENINKNNLVILMRDCDEISSIPEEEMNKHGWFKVDQKSS